MDRQNPFQRHQFFSSGYRKGSRQPSQPSPVRQPTNNPFHREPRAHHRLAYEREQTEVIQYSVAHHSYIELEPIERQRSNDAQFQAGSQRPTYSRQSTTLQASSESLYTVGQEYASERQDINAPMKVQKSSAARAPSSPAGSLYIPTDNEIFGAIYPPLSWVGPVIPRNPIPYPVPRMRDYQNFNDSFHKFIIKGSHPRLIERLNVVAAVDAKTRGYFPDTGLVGIESITRDFCAAEYILFYCDHLVEPIMFKGQGVFAGTFGIMGEDVRTGQWRVRCWIQPSDRISREIQLMAREKLVICDAIVEKTESRARGLDGHMRMQEHEQIWTLIQGWDREMRGKWAESFQAEGGGPRELIGEAYHEFKGQRWEG
ncbi:hypothetical protein E2P81_ATG05957 [Venturia nashicola]|nr:hypothetical protein E2P81_ATG05957 [Venturia nashicola]